jgi:hypothetical protein
LRTIAEKKRPSLHIPSGKTRRRAYHVDRGLDGGICYLYAGREDLSLADENKMRTFTGRSHISIPWGEPALQEPRSVFEPSYNVGHIE